MIAYVHGGNCYYYSNKERDPFRWTGWYTTATISFPVEKYISRFCNTSTAIMCSSLDACCCNKLNTVQIINHVINSFWSLSLAFSCYAAWRIPPLVSVSGLLIGDLITLTRKVACTRVSFNHLPKEILIVINCPRKETRKWMVYPLVRSELDNIWWMEPCRRVWRQTVPPSFITASFRHINIYT